jgi:hypothetical protein
MVRLIVLLILAGVGWQAYSKYHAAESRSAEAIDSRIESVAAPIEPEPAPAFRCDGRTHCSQMSSCAEATYFLKNCPGVKMDGNHDGVPCEQQWCS